MRAFRFAQAPWYEQVGEGGRQEFVAGAIPLRAVIALQDAPLVLVQHRRGFLRAFDEHLDAVREQAVPAERIDYQVTWLGMTGGEGWPPLVRLELRLDGLRARPRLLFVPGAHEPLWLLASGEQFGLVLDHTSDWLVSGPGPHIWVLGRTPVARQLARILDELGIPAPTGLLHDGADCGGASAPRGCAIPAPKRAADQVLPPVPRPGRTGAGAVPEVQEPV